MWSPVKIAIVCGGSDGRAAVERRVGERGFAVHTWRDFLDDLLRPGRTIFDYETRCEISVLDAGAWKYAMHPTNEVLCVAWSHRPDAERVFVAHNVGFEEAISTRHILGWSATNWFRWSCTASRARRLGLPGGLEGACNVLRTPHRKSVEGHRLMLQVSQPRPLWVNKGHGQKWFDDADRLAGTAIYCGEDVHAERDLDDTLPELTPFERAVWEQVERGNRRGLRLDVDLIAAMETLVDGEETRVLAEVRQLTGDPNFSLTAPAAVRQFCAGRGVTMGDLTAATVEGLLSGHRSGARRIDPLAAKVLEGRQAIAKSSNAKLPAMRDRLQEDGFARDYAIFHGAHTGRQTGAKVNPLNLPRPYRDYDQDKVVAAIRSRDLMQMERLGVLPSVAVSASLRGIIVAPEGKTFVIVDYSSIEPCVSFTLAGQWDAVDILRNHGNLYVEMGKTVFGRTISKKDDLREYTICKIIILALGYGMYPAKFYMQLQAAGIDCTDHDAVGWRNAYLARFPMIPKLWAGLEEAAKTAIRNPHQRCSYGSIGYVFDGYWLACFMPNGNPMYYPNARLLPGKYGDDLTYEGRSPGGGWGDVRTWGGSTCENCAQKIGREVLVEDKLEVEQRYGWHVPLDVYDEIVAECDENEVEPLEKMYAVTRRQREWLPQMPVWSEGFVAKRYRKD